MNNKNNGSSKKIKALVAITNYKSNSMEKKETLN